MDKLFKLLFHYSIFDQATAQTAECSALISVDACEEYCSPGCRVVLKPKSQSKLYHILSLSRHDKAIKFPISMSLLEILPWQR